MSEGASASRYILEAGDRIVLVILKNNLGEGGEARKKRRKKDHKYKFIFYEKPQSGGGCLVF